jgi:hypothetical protein
MEEYPQEVVMKEFRVTLGNRPGELARVAESLARKGVSIKSVAASASGGQVLLHLIGHDVEATRSALQEMRAQFAEQEVIVLLLEDKAGELARIANKLALANVNLDAVYLVGRVDDIVEVAIAADDFKKAKKVLEGETTSS